MKQTTVDGFHQQALQQANTRLKAQRDKLLEALEPWIAHVDRFHGTEGYPGNRCEWCEQWEARARAAIAEAKREDA